MSMAAPPDLRGFELARTVPLSLSDQREQSLLRRRRVLRIADDVRACAYPVDADRVADSILRRLVSA